MFNLIWIKQQIIIYICTNTSRQNDGIFLNDCVNYTIYGKHVFAAKKHFDGIIYKTIKATIILHIVPISELIKKAYSQIFA